MGKLLYFYNDHVHATQALIQIILIHLIQVCFVWLCLKFSHIDVLLFLGWIWLIALVQLLLMHLRSFQVMLQTRKKNSLLHSVPKIILLSRCLFKADMGRMIPKVSSQLSSNCSKWNRGQTGRTGTYAGMPCYYLLFTGKFALDVQS